MCPVGHVSVDERHRAGTQADVDGISRMVVYRLKRKALHYREATMRDGTVQCHKKIRHSAQSGKAKEI
jgi:hypothetical protein